MKVIRGILGFVTAVALVVLIVGVGFLACTLPVVTNSLSNVVSDDVTSPFSRSQLVQVADATRDYAFGTHNRDLLYATLYGVDLDYRQDIIMANGILPYGFPDLDSVKNSGDADQVAAAFATASEMYCYTPETISHLDDCFALAQKARVVIAIAALIVLAGLIACGVLGGKRTVGVVLFGAGIAVMLGLAGLAIYAALDFNGFFALFHGLLFSQGNWQFAYDSLLICALPTAFWVGMGIVWLVVSLVISILSVTTGKGLQK